MAATDMTQAKALDLLGLTAGASTEDVLRAYRLRAAASHPDKFGADKQMQAHDLMASVNAARDLLLRDGTDLPRPVLPPKRDVKQSAGLEPDEGMGQFGWPFTG